MRPVDRDELGDLRSVPETVKTYAGRRSAAFRNNLPVTLTGIDARSATGNSISISKAKCHRIHLAHNPNPAVRHNYLGGKVRRAPHTKVTKAAANDPMAGLETTMVLEVEIEGEVPRELSGPSLVGG
jgi:hypothetical protein